MSVTLLMVLAPTFRHPLARLIFQRIRTAGGTGKNKAGHYQVTFSPFLSICLNRTALVRKFFPGLAVIPSLSREVDVFLSRVRSALGDERKALLPASGNAPVFATSS
jgi:hypothetical protein